MNKETKELLAEAMHKAWSDWMWWMLEVSEEKDGSVVIPPDKVERWKRQSVTLYKDLSEEEKQSDRDVVDKYILKIICSDEK